MKEKQRVKFTHGGLVCDNKSCDWEDKTVSAKVMTHWINRPCPKCGENLLTFDDFMRMVEVMAVMKKINSMSEEEFAALTPSTKKSTSKSKKDKFSTFKVNIGTHEKITFDIQGIKPKPKKKTPPKPKPKK